ncbi:MAG: sulfatase [bacterium]|nr:sulfatase [bacterium]
MSTILSRRGFLRRSMSAAAAMASAAGCATAGSAPTRKPNIVFMLIDDLGWADVACYGNTYHETPNIDRLATQGMRFTDAYAACPVCSPTRASIVSGQYPAHLGITDFIPGHLRPWAKMRMPVNRTQYLPLEHVTVAEALKEAGYATAAFGKWHLGGRDHFPDKQGFDTSLVTNGRHTKFRTTPPTEVSDDDYLSETLTDHAEKFMEANRDTPFFLYLSHYAVHIPLDAREALVKKYEAKPKPDGRIAHPVYAAMVEHVDQSVGRIMDKLRELNLEDDTVLVFFSDNGGLQLRFDGKGPFVTENTPLRDEKGSVYEGGVREPLIVRWPGRIKPGSECDVPVTSVDFYPTFLELAGTERPARQVLDGESILPLLNQRGGLDRDAIYWHYPNYHHSTPAGAIREGDWKLIEFFEDGALELYNLKDDIGEAHNLASEMPKRAAALQKKLAAWRTSVNAAMPTPNPDYDPLRAHEWGKRKR